MKLEYKRREISLLVVSGIFGAAIGISLWVGANAVGLKQVSWLGAFEHKHAVLILMSSICALSTCLLFYKLVTGLRCGTRFKSSLSINVPELSFNLRCILKIECLILICWVPWIFAQSPAVLPFDTFNQLYQYISTTPTMYTTLNMYVDAELIDHHPVMTTLLYGFIYDFGKVIGSESIAFFLAAITQCVLLAGELSFACCYMQLLKIPNWFRVLSVLFCCFTACLPQSAMVILKDTTFVLCFLPFFLCYIEIWRTSGSFLRKPLACLLFFIILSGCLVSKKLGIYIAIPSALMLAFFVHNQVRYLVCISASILICLVVIPTFVYPALGGVEQGGKQESLGFAMQQIATVEIERPKAITDNERAELARWVDLDAAVEAYSPSIADGVKNHMSTQITNRDVIKFIPLWFSIGVRSPDLYLTSLLKTTGPLYIPLSKMGVSDYRSDDLWVENTRDTDLEVPFDFHESDAMNEKKNQLFKRYFDTTANMPLVGILFCGGLFGGWIPLMCVLALAVSARKRLPILIPVVVFMFFLPLNPVAHTRYILPLVALAPLIIGSLFTSDRELL